MRSFLKPSQVAEYDEISVLQPLKPVDNNHTGTLTPYSTGYIQLPTVTKFPFICI